LRPRLVPRALDSSGAARVKGAAVIRRAVHMPMGGGMPVRVGVIGVRMRLRHATVLGLEHRRS